MLVANNVLHRVALVSAVGERTKASSGVSEAINCNALVSVCFRECQSEGGSLVLSATSEFKEVQRAY
jgi:hypothetical protein